MCVRALRITGSKKLVRARRKTLNVRDRRAYMLRVAILSVGFFLVLGDFFVTVRTPPPSPKLMSHWAFPDPVVDIDCKIGDQISVDPLEGTAAVDRSIIVDPSLIYRLGPDEPDVMNEILMRHYDFPIYFFEAEEQPLVHFGETSLNVYEDGVRVVDREIVNRIEKNGEQFAAFGLLPIKLNKTTEINFSLRVDSILTEAMPTKCFPFDSHIMDIQYRFPVVFGGMLANNLTLTYLCDVSLPSTTSGSGPATGIYYSLKFYDGRPDKDYPYYPTESIPGDVLVPAESIFRRGGTWYDVGDDSFKISECSPSSITSGSTLSIGTGFTDYGVGGIRLWIGLERQSLLKQQFLLIMAVTILFPLLMLAFLRKNPVEAGWESLLESVVPTFIFSVFVPIAFSIPASAGSLLNTFLILPLLIAPWFLLIHKDPKYGLIGCGVLVLIICVIADFTNRSPLLWQSSLLNVASAVAIFGAALLVYNLWTHSRIIMKDR